MQEDEKPILEQENDGSLKFGTKTKELLGEIAKWARLVAIFGFVVCGILLLAAMAMLFFGEQTAKQMAAAGQTTPMTTTVTGIAYAVMAVLYFFPAKYVYDFAVYTKQAIEHNDQDSIDYSFSRLASLFKFIGMVALVGFGFYILAFLFSSISGGIG